jgi:hypothetical protein
MDGQGLGMRSIGPDLIGVTRKRDPKWLNRWIREPDRLLAEKDPIALQLYEQFERIPMPNLRLDEPSAQSIIDFLSEETERQHPPTAAVADGALTPVKPGDPAAAVSRMQ